MTTTAKFYGLVLKSAFNKEIDLDSDSLKVSLHSSSYTPNQDTHQYKSSLSDEITGTGYTAGGAALGSVTVTYDGPTNTLTFDGADVAWGPGATLSGIRYAVVYDNTPATDATRPLILYVDYGTDQAVTSGTFSINWDALGIATLTAA